MISQEDLSIDCLVRSSVSGKKWVLKGACSQSTWSLSQGLGIPEILARLLVARGYDMRNSPHFLHPTLRHFMADPSHLKDMDRITERFASALKNNETLGIIGDYDVDGGTSTALLASFWTAVGGQVCYHIPDRFQEGYGPSIYGIDQLISQGASLIVTVDCGTTAYKPISYGREKNIDVIVLDHHAGEITMPEAYGIINPNRFDETSPMTYLAGVGVTFITLVSLNRHLRKCGWYEDRPEPDLIDFLDLVALGTVCDVVPLIDLNRAFVHQGLKIMAQRNRLGLRALSDIAQVGETLTAYHLGFLLGPRINAGGRIGKSDLGTRLLLTQDPFEASLLSQELNHLNSERQDIEKQVLEEALSQGQGQEGLSKVLASKNWHGGVIGIVAGRIKDHFYCPTFIFSVDDQGYAKGSGRSIPGVDLGSFVHHCKQSKLIQEGGGHKMAAGVGLSSDCIPAFQSALNDFVKQSGADLSPFITIDSHISLSGVNCDFISLLDQLAPYGQNNPTPRFMVSNVFIAFAKEVGGQHIQCTLSQGDGSRLQCIAFRAKDTPMGDLLLSTHRGRPIHAVGTLKINLWQGQTRPQMIIDDVTLAQLQE
jgi:single-stranded-DNA-specific exonuclease